MRLREEIMESGACVVYVRYTVGAPDPVRAGFTTDTDRRVGVTSNYQDVRRRACGDAFLQAQVKCVAIRLGASRVGCVCADEGNVASVGVLVHEFQTDR